MCTRDRHNARIHILLYVVHIIGFALVWFTHLLLLCEQNAYSSHVCYVWSGSVNGSLILFLCSHSKQQVLLFFHGDATIFGCLQPSQTHYGGSIMPDSDYYFLVLRLVLGHMTNFNPYFLVSIYFQFLIYFLAISLAPDVGGGRNHPEALQRLFEMELRSNPKSIHASGHSQGMYGQELDLGFGYR